MAAFFRRLDELLTRSVYQRLNDRIRVFLYRFPLTFQLVVADPGEWGSCMVVETLLPPDRHHVVNRPRLVLRRRAPNGLYDRYWKAIEVMLDPERSHEVSWPAAGKAGLPMWPQPPNVG